jgi:hypothetical protein
MATTLTFLSVWSKAPEYLVNLSRTNGAGGVGQDQQPGVKDAAVPTPRSCLDALNFSPSLCHVQVLKLRAEQEEG